MQNECAICLQPINDGDTLTILDCNYKCIVDWVNIKHNCPLCRNQINQIPRLTFINKTKQNIHYCKNGCDGNGSVCLFLFVCGPVLFCINPFVYEKSCNAVLSSKIEFSY